MRRRSVIRAGAGALSVGMLAGCIGGDGGEDDGSEDGGGTPQPTEGDGRYDGVYVQKFTDGMAMQGTAEAGDLKIAVMYSAPHRFWRMVGDERKEQPVAESDSMHLMAAVWEPETDIVVPETGLTVEIAPEGGAFDEQVIYPMLSQPMGFHYGANFALDGDGTYDVRVTVGGLNVRRTGAFEGRFGDPATATVGVTFDAETRGEISDQVQELDSFGDPGAIEPMEMMMPDGTLPAAGSMPGELVGSERTDDAVLPLLAVRDDPPVEAEAYLALSARTRYNGYTLPAAGLEATVDRDGETVFEGPLRRTLDPELNYHYGAAVDALESGDEVTVRPVTPPQVSRHRGYERAFLEMEPVSYTV